MSSAKAVSLSEVRSAPNPKVIGELERLLEEARMGEVQGFTAVVMNPGGQSSSCFCGDFDADKALWAIECWKVRLLRGAGA
jgi:1,4-dihydroxy-2-naphthoyl-CoA synthase